METWSLQTVQMLTDGRQLSFDQNHIFEHTLDSIIHLFLLLYAHTLDLVLYPLKKKINSSICQSNVCSLFLYFYITTANM